jgi:phospholipid/cholesterol/gamma-HCH transport system substrate-binding protein
MALPVPHTSQRGGNLFETIISALVIVIAVAFFVYFMMQTGTGHLGSYALRVSLADASGLSVGSGVRVSGAKVGSITKLDLDQKTYRAIVEIRIRDDLFLPADSRATVTASPLGEIYLTLTPGHAGKIVPEGATVGLPYHPSAPAAGA